MGQKQLKAAQQSATSKQSPFKLFQYGCPCCKTKRPIQYFYKNGTFLPQTPRVVCGECNTSVTVEPYKTVEYECPACRKQQKARLPGRPVPLNTYNMSVVTCNCGFRGEVPVGCFMDVACTQCFSRRRELRGVWTEDGDEIKAYCDTCNCMQRSFAKVPEKKGKAQPEHDLEYNCENCFRVQPMQAEELLRNQGLACCKLCNWVGYPEVFPRASSAANVENRKSGRGGRSKRSGVSGSSDSGPTSGPTSSASRKESSSRTLT